MLVKFIGPAAPIRSEYGPWLMGSCISRRSAVQSVLIAPLRKTAAFDCASKLDGTHAIGSAVVDLIFSIANRDVTFFIGTAPISRL